MLRLALTLTALLTMAGASTAAATGANAEPPRPSACQVIRIMDEKPNLSGTRTVLVCEPTKRTHLYEDPSDLEWSWVVLDGRYVGIPPDSRVGTWNP